MAGDWRSIAATVLRSFGRAKASGAKGRVRDAGRRTPGELPTTAAYPGDFTGSAPIEYSPRADGLPDPGEIVWTWVPYEEDHTRGKDRPVLVVARDSGWLLALMLTSKDHDGTGGGKRRRTRAGEEWIDLGSGAWDGEGRPSEVRVDRVVRIDPSAVRREGAQLDAARFELVAGRLRASHGWV